MVVVRRIVVCGVVVLGEVTLRRGWYNLQVYRGHEILVLQLVREMVVVAESRCCFVVVGAQRRVGRRVVAGFVGGLRLVFDPSFHRSWDVGRLSCVV